MMTNNNHHQAVGFFCFQPFVSVNFKTLGFGAETPLLSSGRASWHV